MKSSTQQPFGQPEQAGQGAGTPGRKPRRPTPEESLLRILKQDYSWFPIDRGTIEEVLKAARAREWTSCMLWLPKPYRLSAFWSVIRQQVTDADYWEMLSMLWTLSEGPGHEQFRFLGLFLSPRGDREHLMTADGSARYRALPPSVKLYRGAIPRYARGMSWTTDLEEAAWFARRFDLGQVGHIYQATVGREAVVACFDGECEMVIDPRPLPPLRAMSWTLAEMDRMAERAAQRKQIYYSAIGKAVLPELDLNGTTCSTSS